MKKINVNFKTVFLGIIAVMLTTLVIMVGTGFILAKNMFLMPQGEYLIEEVISEREDTVVIIED